MNKLNDESWFVALCKYKKVNEKVFGAYLLSLAIYSLNLIKVMGIFVITFEGEFNWENIYSFYQIVEGREALIRISLSAIITFVLIFSITFSIKKSLSTLYSVSIFSWAMAIIMFFVVDLATTIFFVIASSCLTFVYLDKKNKKNN